MNKVTFLKSMPFSVCKSNFLNQLAHVKSLPQIKELQLKIDMYDIIIEYLESVIRMVNNRSYQIKNAIEWKSFI